MITGFNYLFLSSMVIEGLKLINWAFYLKKSATGDI